MSGGLSLVIPQRRVNTGLCASRLRVWCQKLILFYLGFFVRVWEVEGLWEHFVVCFSGCYDCWSAIDGVYNNTDHCYD